MVLFLRQTDGLGNQLFQYAAGLYFSRLHQAPLTVIRDPIDTSPSGHRPRPFMLPEFCISAAVRERTMWDRVVCAKHGSRALLGAAARFISRTQIYDQHVRDAWQFIKALDVKPSTRTFYLKGYLQAHQFTVTFEADLRRELRFKRAPNGQNAEVLRRINLSEMPISLHVRRGDYATTNNGGTFALPMTYYDNAILELRRRMPMATFFVFSDDIAFARSHLEKHQGLVFVDHNDEAHGFEDLRLMSSCRHHIIANSTLSWWGAWLNPKPDKLVFAPERWIMPQYPHTDLIPSTWIRLATSPPIKTTDPLHVVESS